MLKKLGKTSLILTGLLLLGGLLISAAPKSSATLAARTHYMEADYPAFRSLRTIVASSDAVVIGTVTKVLPAYRVVPNGIALEQLPKEKADAVGFVVTDIVVSINRVLSGNSSLANTELRVAHLGGQSGNQQYIAEAEPMSQQGQTYLFFLKHTEQDLYVTVGGPQGRYQMQGEQLIPVSEEARTLPLAGILSSMKLAKLADTVASLANTETDVQASAASAASEAEAAALEAEAGQVDEPLNDIPALANTDKTDAPSEVSTKIFLPLIEQ